MFSSGTPTRTPRRASSRRAGSAVPPGVATSASTARETPPPRSSARTTLAAPRTITRTAAASPAPSASGSRARRAKSTLANSDSENEQIGTRATEEVERVLVRDENYVVLERRGLPVEVEQIVSTADPYTDPFRATLDSVTGFAFLISRDFCFVWNWSRRSSNATTYVFRLPPSTSLPAAVSIFSPLSFAAFVPTATEPSKREPGLIIVGTTGEIRYWENVSMALSGANRWKAGDAELAEGELIRGITMHSPTSFLLTTSHSRVLQISLNSIGGKTELGVRAFDRAVGWAGSVWNFFGGKGADPRAGILALALSSPSSKEGERIAYAVLDRNVQVWRLPGRDDVGGERLFVEQDVFAGVLEAVAGKGLGNEAWAINAGKVEILDALVTPDGNLAVLISHVTHSTALNSLSYAIVSLEVGTTQGSVTVLGIRHLSYQTPPDPRPLSSPKLSLGEQDSAFVVFVDTVVLISLGSHLILEETFPLRSATNRFLGLSTSSSLLSLLTSSGSTLSIELTAQEGNHTEDRQSESFKTKKLKSKIEQAIFFGGANVDNPLAFDLLPDFEGDLEKAAEAVSAEILASSSANMPSIIDLRTQLADRVLRARALIDYINSNGLVGKLSQSSRRQLSQDAERLSAAVALWHHQNARLADGESNLLGEAVHTLLRDSGEHFGEDLVRYFFRTQVTGIGALVEQITKLTKNQLNTSADNHLRSATLHEANALILLVFKAVARHRLDSSTLYALDPTLLPTELWTSRPSILEGLQYHFEASTALLRERIRDFGSALEEDSHSSASGTELANQQALQKDFKSQMAELAGFVFRIFEERILVLGTAMENRASATEYRAVSERYLVVRSHIIHVLVDLDKITQAYELAERHGDFRSLVELSNDPKHGSASRTKFFMEKYSEDFAFALYNFFLEKGSYRELMGQDEIYRPLLTKFLENTSLPRLDWINDLAIGRYAHATESLVGEATKEQSLAQKKLMLSIGKLSEVAQATKNTIDTRSVQEKIEVVDDLLDVIQVQETTQKLFYELLAGTDLRLDTGKQGEVLTSRAAPGLHNRPAFAQLFSTLSAQLLEHRTLSPEELVDLLTLKQNDGKEVSSFDSALSVLIRAKDIPGARHTIALQNIWRRIYLRDDWSRLYASSGLTDDQLSNALRNTALSATLHSSAKIDQPPAFFLTPTQAFFDGTADEIAARFPDATPEFVEALLVDYEAENEELREALENYGLEGYCAEIGRLFEAESQGMME